MPGSVVGDRASLSCATRCLYRASCASVVHAFPDLSCTLGLAYFTGLTWHVECAWPGLLRAHGLRTLSSVVGERTFCRSQLCRDLKILCRDIKSLYSGQLCRDIELLCRDIIHQNIMSRQKTLGLANFVATQKYFVTIENLPSLTNYVAT